MAFTMEVPDEAEIKKEVLEQVKPVPKEVSLIRELAKENAEYIMEIR